jgi:hypothetical protein
VLAWHSPPTDRDHGPDRKNVAPDRPHLRTQPDPDPNARPGPPRRHITVLSHPLNPNHYSHRHYPGAHPKSTVAIHAPPHPQPPIIRRSCPPHPRLFHFSVATHSTAASRSMRADATVPEWLDDRAGSANPKIYARLCSRWHRRRMLPQGTEQIKIGADRGRCSFSPLDPRHRSSFSSMSHYPDATLMLH